MTRDRKSREIRMKTRNSRIYIIGYNDFNSMMVPTWKWKIYVVYLISIYLKKNCFSFFGRFMHVWQK
jgi:hypothetical protein